MEPLGELGNGRSVDSARVKVRNLYGVRKFVRPDGRQRQEVIENMPNDLKSHLDAIKKAGCRLTAEVTFNNVSFCIECREAKDDFDMEICANGPLPVAEQESAQVWRI